MTDRDLYKIGNEFQDNLLKVFNNCNLPFILKYFLFEEIWQIVKQENFNRKNEEERTVDFPIKQIAENN